MNFYFLPFIFLTLLTSLESSKKFEYLIKNKFLYSLIALILIIFIGLRHEIGCDWSKYQGMFEWFNSFSLAEIIERNLFQPQKFQELGHIFLTNISKNIYILNLIYASIFVIPLFYVFSELKRKYFAILISYPYYLIVVGMGPSRQAACISLFMLSIILVSNKKYYSHLFILIFTSFIHQSSIFFNGLILSNALRELRKIKISRKNISIMILIALILSFSLPTLIGKIHFLITSYNVYDKVYEKLDRSNNLLVTPAKSAIYIWLINFIPSLIYLKNKSKFNLNKNLKSIFTTLGILEILILPIVLLNSVIGYRLLLYFFPTSIFITSLIPDLNLVNIKKTYIINFLVVVAFLNLIIWLNFAYHSSCWIPYKNILFNF
jgi:hypothetical protein